MNSSSRGGRNHKHNFKPLRRKKHILTEKCNLCPKTKTIVLGDISEERISALDKQIESRKNKK